MTTVEPSPNTTGQPVGGFTGDPFAALHPPAASSGCCNSGETEAAGCCAPPAAAADDSCRTVTSAGCCS